MRRSVLCCSANDALDLDRRLQDRIPLRARANNRCCSTNPELVRRSSADHPAEPRRATSPSGRAPSPGRAGPARRPRLPAARPHQARVAAATIGQTVEAPCRRIRRATSAEQGLGTGTVRPLRAWCFASAAVPGGLTSHGSSARRSSHRAERGDPALVMVDGAERCSSSGARRTPSERSPASRDRPRDVAARLYRNGTGTVHCA
jgi:hypothetical protein